MSAHRLDRITRLVALAAIAALLATGCASKTIHVPRLKPAEVNLGPVKKVAVSAIEGEHGPDVADAIQQAVMGSGRYEVIDRQHVAQILQEQQLTVLSEGNAGQLGGVLGAAALIFGRVSQDEYGEKVEGSEATCTEGKVKYTCTNYTRTAGLQFGVTLKVVEAKSGAVLATKVVSATPSQETHATAKGTKVSDAGQLAEIIPPIQQEHPMRTAAVAQVVGDFMKMIAPYTVQVPVVLYDESDLPSTKAGVGFARTGSWASAIEAFTKGIEEAKNLPEPDPELSARAQYNLGVALGYSGQYDEGITAIKQAFATYPEEDFLKEVGNLEQFKRDDAKLEEQRKSAEGAGAGA